jgi:hypothetical protein
MIYSSVFSTFSPNDFSALRINTTVTMICMPLRCAGLLADGDGPKARAYFLNPQGQTSNM